MKKTPIILLLTLITQTIAIANIQLTQDIELGNVHWLRDMNLAIEKSKAEKKPILILFQEVPGCSTCRNYGADILSHPLIVEAIETYFIPLCIHNNKSGKDRLALEYFNEPSWNNPVIRVVNDNLKPITGRLFGNYSAYGLVEKIIASLISLDIKIPEYLGLLEEQTKAEYFGIEEITLGMYCFWSGEKTYGKLKGVIATNAGYMNGSEVVQIQFNPNIIPLQELLHIGKINKTADKLFSQNKNDKQYDIPIYKPGIFKLDPETKYYLQQTPYKYIPMTPLQATRINSLLSEGKSCELYLSPRQRHRYAQILKLNKTNLKNQIGKNISLAWYENK